MWLLFFAVNTKVKEKTKYLNNNTEIIITEIAVIIIAIINNSNRDQSWRRGT